MKRPQTSGRLRLEPLERRRMLAVAPIDDPGIEQAVAAPAVAGAVEFATHTITTDADSAHSVFAADLDGDGDLDVLSASYLDDKIAWYENLSAPLADLTGNGFVDFEDLTVLLANWNKDVTAADGNLVEPLTSVVNFEDLTVLLAAWTGPGGAGSPPAAVAEATVSEVASVSTQDTTTAKGRLATSVHFDRLRRRDDVTLRRAGRRNDVPISRVNTLRRLQAAAVDRALAEEATTDRAKVIRRRAGSSARL